MPKQYRLGLEEKRVGAESLEQGEPKLRREWHHSKGFSTQGTASKMPLNPFAASSVRPDYQKQLEMNIQDSGRKRSGRLLL